MVKFMVISFGFVRAGYTHQFPYIKPVMVAISTTRAQYTRVFCVPRMVRITSMLGNDRAGPASNSANAGPLPIPEPIRASTMGTSVRVEKYIRAPSTDARMVERSEEHTSELQSRPHLVCRL